MQEIVIAAINKLVAQNKQPSVALVKANLSQPVPMPVIIEVLSRFKQNPDDFIVEPNLNKTDLGNTEPSNVSQLDRIEQKLDQILSLLNKNT